MSIPQLHADTKCRVITDLRFEFQLHNFKVVFDDGTLVMYNLRDDWETLKTNPDSRFFMIDSTDLENMEKVWKECRTLKEVEEKTEDRLGSITKFSTFFPKKKIYLRMVPPLTVGSQEENRVFADEVMEIIPIAKKQQSIPIMSVDVRLFIHRAKWAEVPLLGAYRTLSVSELEEILDEFDIDKSQITLVPDPSHEKMRRELLERGGHIRFFAPDKNIVSDMYQAVNHIFQVVVMGLNWKKDQCQEHYKCNERMKPMIMKFFEELCRYPDFCLDCAQQFKFINLVRNQCDLWSSDCYRFNRDVPDYFWINIPAEGTTKIDNYNLVVNHFDIPKYPFFIPPNKDKLVRVWMVRVLCKLGWIQQFFNERDNQNVKNIMIECLYFMVPEQHIEAAREFVKSVLCGKIKPIKFVKFENPASKKIAAVFKKNSAGYKQKKEGNKQLQFDAGFF